MAPGPLRLALILILSLAPIAFSAEPLYNVVNFGADPAGRSLSTAPLQKAIDAAHAAGGGTVLLPPGRYLSGTLFLRSHVHLRIDPAATLLGSADLQHYPPQRAALRSYTDNYVTQALLWGENLDDISLSGGGAIDGQGASFKSPPGRPYANRPYGIRLISCRDVRVENLTLRNSAMWMQHYLACDRLTLRNLRVDNHVNANNDGIDVDACRDVLITGCTVDSDDDAICLKSTLDRPCENVRISDCIARSHCNGIKLGTESNGGFRNIAITNCIITSPPATGQIYGARRGLAALALETVDGGTLDNIVISNISIRGVSVPLFLRLGNRARPFSSDAPKPAVGAFRNVALSHIIATDVSPVGSSITGLPNHPIENLTLQDIRLTYEGGGRKELATKTPEEHPAKYPEATMFGDLPAWGLYVRHVHNLRITDLDLKTARPDFRHALLCDDVTRLRLRSVDLREPAGSAYPLQLTNVPYPFIQDTLRHPDAGPPIELHY